MNIIIMYNNYNCFLIFEDLDLIVFFNFLCVIKILYVYVFNL